MVDKSVFNLLIEKGCDITCQDKVNVFFLQIKDNLLTLT